jgi:hypothetical protein
MVTYTHTAAGDISVWVEGRRVGTIRQQWKNRAFSGFLYVPKGRNAKNCGSEQFTTLRACKTSIEDPIITAAANKDAIDAAARKCFSGLGDLI